MILYPIKHRIALICGHSVLDILTLTLAHIGTDGQISSSMDIRILTWCSYKYIILYIFSRMYMCTCDFVCWLLQIGFCEWHFPLTQLCLSTLSYITGMQLQVIITYFFIISTDSNFTDGTFFLNHSELLKKPILIIPWNVLILSNMLL